MAECRICKQQIDKEKDDWVMPSRNYYFHRKCYHDWKKTEPLVDEEWKPFIYDFISRDLKVSYNYHMVEAQLKKFLKEKMTMKGVYFALKYFYDIKGNDWDKGNGGIGIVPYIYKDAFNYYYQIWLAQQKNQDFKIEEYHPEEIVIKIPRPERPIKKRQLFTFLDEGDDTIE